MPRMWMLDKADISGDSYNKFRDQFEKFREIYKMDSILYYASTDNRIIVDLDKEKYLHILYNEFKRKKELHFSEIEEGLVEGAIVQDDQKNKYINECVFSVLNINQNRASSELYNGNSELCETDRRKTLCESGWIYFKLYGIGHRGDEIISMELPKLLGNLDCPEHFFLRYSDELGEHLRIRVKCVNEETAYIQLSVGTIVTLIPQCFLRPFNFLLISYNPHRHPLPLLSSYPKIHFLSPIICFSVSF